MSLASFILPLADLGDLSVGMNVNTGVGYPDPDDYEKNVFAMSKEAGFGIFGRVSRLNLSTVDCVWTSTGTEFAFSIAVSINLNLDAITDGARTDEEKLITHEGWRGTSTNTYVFSIEGEPDEIVTVEETLTIWPGLSTAYGGTNLSQVVLERMPIAFGASSEAGYSIGMGLALGSISNMALTFTMPITRGGSFDNSAFISATLLVLVQVFAPVEDGPAVEIPGTVAGSIALVPTVFYTYEPTPGQATIVGPGRIYDPDTGAIERPELLNYPPE